MNYLLITLGVGLFMWFVYLLGRVFCKGIIKEIETIFNEKQKKFMETLIKNEKDE